MFKKILSLLLASAILLSMAGCGKYFFPDKKDPEPSPAPVPPVSDPVQPDAGETAEPEADQNSATQYEILPDNLVQKLERAANCFTVAPEEFSDPATLSADAMLYAALLRGAGEFLPMEGNDEYLSYLPISALPKLVESVFGDGAALPSGYENGNYYPYEISLSEERIYRHSEDIGTLYFFTTEAVMTAPGEYRLKLANLQDPDFYEVYGQYMADGLKPTKAMVDEFEGKVMTYCYTLKESGSSYIITSFLYENFEDIWSEIY